MSVRNNIIVLSCLMVILSGPFVQEVFAGGDLTTSHPDPGFSHPQNIFKQPSLLKRGTGIAAIYNFAIGACGGFNSGLTFKKFMYQEGAVECILSTRWHGISMTIFYEACEGVLLRGDGLIWNFGLGPRVGFFQGKYYRDYLNKSREDRLYSVLGIAGTFGAEYCFKKAPLSLGLDYRPYFDLKGADDSVIDFALNLRFIFE